jgi:2-iminobutanoate/2-iminopropanoate deaminase
MKHSLLNYLCPEEFTQHGLFIHSILLLIFIMAMLPSCKTTKPDTKIAVLTPNAPAPIGPYSQAVIKGKFLFVSGQIALNPITNRLDTSNIAQETKQVMENIKAILQQADMDFKHVVKATIYLTDISTFSQINEVYATYMPGVPAARETVEVRRLPRGAHIEISVIALQD